MSAPLPFDGNPAPTHPSQSISCWVFVSNLPRDVNESWVRMLFASIGVIDSVTLTANETSGSAYILFRTADQAKAALHLNGFAALGINLQVRHPTPFETATLINATEPLLYARSGHVSTPPAPMVVHPRMRSTNPTSDQGPSHKNLYVLNLPLDATTDELTALFTSYGSVVHCVILAMLDTQARRRGFIDMSSPKEAKEAIEGLNGFVWHGYPIEVSYAIVQRSGGPFDQGAGRSIIKRNVPRNRFNTGPRRIPSDSALDVSLYSSLAQQFNRQMSFGQADAGSQIHDTSAHDNALSSPGTGRGAVVDPLTIFIAGLDPVAIIDDDDFRHALEPYGMITAATLCRDDNGTSRGFGIVTFVSAQSATNACEAINGKVINGRRLTAHKYAYQSPLSSGTLIPESHVGTAPLRRFTSSGPATMGILPNVNQMTTQSAGYPSFLPQTQTSSLLSQVSSNPSSAHWPLHSPAPYFTKTSQYADTSPLGAAWTSSSTSQPMSGIFSAIASSKEQPPLFSKPPSHNRAVEIKPDPKDTASRRDAQDTPAKLGEAFMPRTGEKDSPEEVKHCDQYHPDRVTDSSSGDVTQVPPTTTGTPSQGLSWDGKMTTNTDSLGLEGMSPQSMLSTPGTVSTANLLTPDTQNRRDTGLVWSHRQIESGSNGQMQLKQSGNRPWQDGKLSGDALKHIGQTGSALLSLQSDVVDKKSRSGMPLLAPVGHEKSSPLRASAAKPRNGL